ncbi:UNVERIFIED_CONTAM: hypothetical protein PYX00_011846 [Menopon gallinae]|uniref:Mechanosensitive ion channel MscS domain-containing protein n=1 Tax=Menopon gallinae TaxID=328185 RepID=A0AAW2H8S2_9NEOP
MIGYVRVLLLVMSLKYYFPVLYAMSMSLDLIDGEVARRLGQCTFLGSILDMAIDRVSNVVILCKIVSKENGNVLLPLLILDFLSHFMYFTGSMAMRVSHKRSTGLLSVYYDKRVLIPVCALSEMYFLACYLSLKMRFVLCIFYFVKSFFHAVQLVSAIGTISEMKLNKGKIKQCDYALVAAINGSLSVGACSEDGVVLASLKKLSPLVDRRSVFKVQNVCDTIGMTYAGLQPDFRVMFVKAVSLVEDYKEVYGHYPFVDVFVTEFSQIIQEHTQKGGFRPFGVLLLVCGAVHSKEGPQPAMYQMDPSGSFISVRSGAIGKDYAQSVKYIENRLEMLDDNVVTCLNAIRENSGAQVNEEDVDIGIFSRKSGTEDPEPTRTSGGGNSVPLYMAAPLAIALTVSEPSSLTSFKSLASSLYTSILRASFSPFKKGDYIRTQGHEGIVQDMDFMYLRLLRRDKAHVFIPTPSVYKNIIESNIAECKRKLEKAMQLSSTCPQIYQTLGTIFEEQGNMEKAFYFFLIAAYIKKTDFELWKKLYFFTFELNMLEERVKILAEIQKIYDSRDIVLEKIWLCKEIGSDFRASEMEAELIKFEGCVPAILYSAMSKLKNALQVRKVCKKVLLIAMKRQLRMDISFMLQLVYISFKSKCFYYLRKFFHKNVISTFERLSLDLRLIFLITEIMCTDTLPEAMSFFAEYSESDIYANLDLILYLADALYFKRFYDACQDVLRLLSSLSEINHLCFVECDVDTKQTIGSSTGRKHGFLMLQSAARTAVVRHGPGMLAGEAIAYILRKEERMRAESRGNDASALASSGEERPSQTMVKKFFGSSVVNRRGRSPFLKDEVSIRQAPLLVKLNRKDEGLKLYLRLYAEDPLNYQVKQAISDLYHELGAYDLARQYSIKKDAVDIINDLTDVDKRVFRYSIEECRSMREIFLSVSHIDPLNADISCIPGFLRACQPLIRDCESNPFLLNSDKKFKAFLTQDERLGSQTPDVDVCKIIEEKKDLTVREKRYKSARLMSLHGLDINEWYCVLGRYVLGCHRVGQGHDATRILKKALSSFILRDDTEILVKMAFLGIRIAVQSNDLGLLIHSVKKLDTKLSARYFSLVYYFLNFLRTSLRRGDFMAFQRNLQRLYRRKLRDACSDTEELYPDSSESDEGTLRHATKEHESLFMYLNSCLPNFLYPSTLERICRMTRGRAKTIETEIILSAIFLCQSVSRKISNRKLFIDRGLGILTRLEKRVAQEDKAVVWYNLGRAYHQFGILGIAERFYRKSLNTENVELRNMAAFNLVLIYRKNKSAALHRGMLETLRKLEDAQ